MNKHAQVAVNSFPPLKCKQSSSPESLAINNSYLELRILTSHEPLSQSVKRPKHRENGSEGLAKRLVNLPPSPKAWQIRESRLFGPEK